MANFFISGLGTLDQTVGWFTVPVGTTIYFFNPPHSVLESHYSKFFMDQLCTELISPTAESYVRALSIEVAPEGEHVPNYVTMGSEASEGEPPGVYLVGRCSSKGPVIPLLDGVKRTLKDLVSGIGEGGSIGTHVYWGVSRQNRRPRVGHSPKQYFDLQSQKNPPPGRGGRGSRYRHLSDSSSPLGSAGFILAKPEAQVDYIDFPRFREFKVRLRAGYDLGERKLA